MLDGILHTGIGALFPGHTVELIPFIGDTVLHVRGQDHIYRDAVCAGYGDERSGALIGCNLYIGKIGCRINCSGTKADGDAGYGEHGEKGNENLFHNCICEFVYSIMQLLGKR